MFKLDLLMSQFRYEIESYKRILNFFTEENIKFKKRLSDFIIESDINDNDFMEQVEYFHNYLLKEDEYMSFLKNELTDQEKLMSQAGDGDIDLAKEMLNTQHKIRKEFQFVEDDFHKLTFDLHNYMSAFFSTGMSSADYHFM